LNALDRRSAGAYRLTVTINNYCIRLLLRRNMLIRASKLALTGIALLLPFFVAPSAHADPVTLVITNASQVGSGLNGTVHIFAATVTNPNAVPFTITSVTLDGALRTVGLPGTPPNFITNPVPALSIVSGNLLLFRFTETVAPGIGYSGIVHIAGLLEGDPSGQFFSINVLINVPHVPEPATMVLLGTGLTAVAMKVRRRRKKQAD
jgi:PEP-CTERM motif